MSYIDTFDHEYLGQLGYLPIYHPLVTVELSIDDDFACAPDNLVLGGGSGEHPGLVIHNLEVSVARFLLELVTDENEPIIGSHSVQWLQDAICSFSNSEVLRFSGWSIRDIARLEKMAGSELFFTQLRENQSVEDWLLMSLGEFIYYSLPDLNPVPIKVLDDFRKVTIRPIMNNVLCPPPGYPPRGGRLVIDGQLHWGKCRWGNPT